MSDAVLIDAVQPESSPRRPVLSTRSGVLLARAGIGLVAVGLRAYELRDVPRLTDETDEVMRGLAVARGELLPLTNVDAYIGPLWSYLLALGFLVVGPTSLMPRVLTLAAALATVAATAWLGRELALRLGRSDRAQLLGLGAALLIATSSFHAVVSSRIAWSHALTPLALTVALACLLRWERTRSARMLAAMGFAYGLAVHTHPTALAIAPGLGVWALLSWRETIAGRGGWIALGLFLLANLPILVFNAATGFGSAAEAAQVQRAYAAGATGSFDGYFGNLGAMLASVPLLLAGEIGERRGVMRTLDSPIAFVWGGLLVVGLLLAARRRVVLPLLLCVSAALVFPLFNGKYEPLFNGRYLAPMLPLAFALVVYVVSASVDVVRLALAWRTAAQWLLTVALCVPSIASLGSYLSFTATNGPNNRELYRAAAIMAAAGTSKPVLVDATFSGTRASTGRDGTGVLEYILSIDTPLSVRRYQPDALIAAVGRGESDLVVVSTRLLARLEKGFVLELPPGEAEARLRRRAPFAVTRIVNGAHGTPDLDLLASARLRR